MKKVLKILVTSLLALTIVGAVAGCTNSDLVNRDGRYVYSDDGQYYFLVISGTSASMYYSDKENFNTAVKLENGKYTVTKSNDEELVLKNTTLLTSTTYKITTGSNGRLALKNEDKDRTFEKVG